MKKIIILLVALFAFYQYIFYIPSSTGTIYSDEPISSSPIAVNIDKKDVSPEYSSDDIISNAYENRLNDVQVQGRGTVVKILRDDLDGRRHQKFIISLSSGQTLLVAHNIDLAPRINSIRTGDTIEFYGEYEWNSKGGVIHWTHHDPRHRHIDGWLKHNGRTYQ